MKRVFFLLCACACLAATAAILPDKRAELHDVHLEKVMKHQKFDNLLKTTVAPEPGGATYKQFMDGAKKSLQDKKVNRENLVNKRAPRRLSDNDIINNLYVCFLYAYDVMDGEPVEADPFFAGMGAYWYPDASDGLYFAGFYWDQDGSTYYLPIDVDYSTGEVSLPWGILLRDDSIIGTARNRTDTVWFEMIVSEAYWNEMEQTDCMGTLYNDGSIIFDDNYVYYTYKEERKYQNRVLVNTDITEAATMFVGTEILAANGILTYNMEKDGSYDESPVYMYEDDNYDLYVGNMWNYGMPYCKMTLTEDYKAIYNCAEFDPVDSVTYLSNPMWDVNDTWISGGLGMFYPVSDYQLDSQGYVIGYTWGFEADGTPDQITWPYTMPCNGYHFLYGFENNVLTYTNGNIFIYPTAIVRGDVNIDGTIDIYDVISLVDHLRSGDFDDSDNFRGDNADANGNGEIGFDDIDAIYDYLMTGTWPEQS